MARLLMPLGVVTSITLLLAQLSPAFGETRVALVIGNEAYQDVPRLRNPANDANAVAAALKRSGFDTIVAVNLDQRGMEDAAIRFSRAARTADIALFYYSGHALQFNGMNYLVPVDTILRDEADLRRMTRMDQIVEDLQQAKNLRILVLDSCRDNPFAEQLRRSIGNTRAVPIGNGLAKIDAPQGMILAYATQAGRTAEDGTGNNSPYTAAFLKHIEKQEEIGTIFREISEDVYETTKHTQLPELSLSIIGRFYLRGKGSADAGASPAHTPNSDFEAAVAIDTVAGWDAFLKQHSEGVYADLARQRKAEIENGKQAALMPPKPSSDDPRAAAERGDADAQHKLGTMYREGRGVTRDYAQAVVWFRKAAEQGHAGAQNSLGSMYRDGDGVARDDAQALAWIRKAVDQGDARAHSNLGWMYENGRGVARDYAQAVAWYRKAADQGYVPAQFNVGTMYASGKGVRRDDAQAVAWFRKAADQGHAEAQASLGVMYATGRGVTLDYAQAVALFRQAANQGSADAQNNLGTAYLNGQGVPRDHAQAAIWLRKAADQGNAHARDKLRRMGAD